MTLTAENTAAGRSFVRFGSPVLTPGVERYVVAGGGSGVFELGSGDRITISQIEGGQGVELVAFAKSGASDLAALGLKGQGRAIGLERILGSNRDDAERVRFGLFRRGLDIGRATAAYVFNSATPLGASLSAVAERPVVTVVAAPAEAMTVWAQTPPTDILVVITRAKPLPAGQEHLPDPLAEPRLDMRIDVASAISFEVYEGEYIQIVDIAGQQCSDFLAFERRALDKGKLLGLDATTTRTMTGLAYPKPGLAARFY